MQKSILPIVLLPSLALALTACGSGEPQSIVLPTTTAAAPIQTHTPNQADSALTQELEKAQNELKALNEKLAEIQKNPTDTPAADQPAPNQADSALAQKLEKAQSEIKALTEKLAEIQKNTNTAAGTTPAPTTPAPTTTVAPPPAVSKPSGTHPAPQPPTTQPPTATMSPPATDNSSGQPSSGSSPAPATGRQNTGDSAPTPPNNVVNPPPTPPSVATPPASGGTSTNTGSTGDSSTGTATTGGGTSAGTSGDGSSDAGTPSGQPSDDGTSTPVPPKKEKTPPAPEDPPAPTTPKEEVPAKTFVDAVKDINGKYNAGRFDDTYQAFVVSIDPQNANATKGEIITSDSSDISELTIDGVKIKLLAQSSDKDVKLRKLVKEDFPENGFDASKTSIVGSKQGGSYGPFSAMRYGVYNAESGKTHLFVYGREAKSHNGLKDANYDGSAIIGKDGKYQELVDAVKAKLNIAEAKLDVTITVAKDDKLVFNADFDKTKKTFFGDTKDFTTQGAVFGYNELGGVFEVHTGKHAGENGVFGTTSDLNYE